MAPDDALEDGAYVIRGGVMELVTLHRAIHLCEHRRGFFGLSFFGENHQSVEEIVTAASRRLPQGRIRVSTMGRLRRIGHEPFRDGEWPHLTLRFETRPTDPELEELISAFDPETVNPAHAT